MKAHTFTCIALILFAFAVELAHAQSLVLGPDGNLAWTAPTSGGIVEGYNFKWGPTAGTWPNVTDVGNVLTVTGAGAGLSVVGNTCAVVTAYNVVNESGPSNELCFFFENAAPGNPENFTAPK